MQFDSLIHTSIKATVINDYSTDFGSEICLQILTDEPHLHLFDVSDTFELEQLKENLEEILKHVTEAYNYTRGFNI